MDRHQLGAHEDADVLGDCDGGQTHEAGQFPAIGGAVQELGEDVKSVPVTEGGEGLGQLDARITGLGEIFT